MSYEELCWMLAKKEISSKTSQKDRDTKTLEESCENALKFFHTWISQCIEIGGANLPKTISSLLGSKLAKIYKEKGITDIADGLKESYDVLDGTTQITKVDSTTLEVKNEYDKSFCPIGGKYNPKNVDIIQNSLCYPYTMGFLSELDQRYKFSATIHECILKSNKNACCYTLNLEEKQNKK